MKNLNKIISSALALILLAAPIATSFANSTSSDSKDSIEGANMMSESEINEILISLEDTDTEWLKDTITYLIYDQNDNLLIEKEIQRGAPINDRELVKALAQSDLIMTYNNSSYYRISEH